jgi:hypothetical protein
MRTLVLVFATVVTLLIASTASAALPISYIDYPTDNTDPTVKTCIAYSAYGQRCRDCRVNWNPDGSASSFTCVGVTVNKYCTCGDTSRGGCYPKGQCLYY